MNELSEHNAVAYLRGTGRISAEGEVLVQALSGGIANVVLRVLDLEGGERVGTDVRTEEERSLGRGDMRPRQGMCFVLKQPLGKFRAAAEWIVDVERMRVEKDAMELLGEILPAGSVPRVLWFDEANYILAMSCAPAGAVIWKKELLAGKTSMDASTHAGMLLAMLHSPTQNDRAVEKRYGDPTFFVQQRVDAYLHATAEKHPELAGQLWGIGEKLLAGRQCLIHGDFSPKNIFLVPEEREAAIGGEARTFALSHLMLLDFEVAFYGHSAFDVATLINHFLLKGFLQRGKWRPYMVLADNFWETYRHTAEADLVRGVEGIGGHVLGALMLARVDGKSPAEYLVGNLELQEQVRRAAKAILAGSSGSLERAMDTVSGHFDTAE